MNCQQLYKQKFTYSGILLNISIKHTATQVPGWILWL